jgi:UDP-N-acetylmuramoyl-tripeptide--D-alanyl-D-alanine ligase
MTIVEGVHGTTIIDDTYNSSPDAALSGLSTLRTLECSGTKIAILGDMMELGKYSAEEHRKVGEKAKKICNVLVTIGPRAKLMSKDSVYFDSSVKAGEYLKEIVNEGDVVLLKASQSIRLERATKMLLVDESKAGDLLVRQEPEWLAKK